MTKDLRNHKNKSIPRFIFVLIILVVGLVLWHQFKGTADTALQQKSTSKTSSTSSNFNKHQYSLTDPNSIWVVVNKQLPLNPKTYQPSDLVVPSIPLRVPGNETMQVRQVTATALETMFTAAAKQGINLMLSSGYRSYAYQVSLYNGYVQTQGQATADQQSARPGYSEHQTGLAADIEPASRMCEVEQCFAQTPEGKWLATNAYKYGFIIRYPADKVATTGYEYEPWHVRYIGLPLAAQLHNQSIETLEEFFNLPGGSNYSS